MSYKSKRAKLTDIPKSVKEKVFKRDGGRCVVCHNPGIPNAHFKRRSQGGLGIEQNVVTLCNDCHEDFDSGFYREQIETIIREYLKSVYGTSWNESDLVYNKWKDYKFNK